MPSPKPNQSYSDEQKDAAVDAYVQGWPYRRIEAEIGIDMSTVLLELDKRGIPTRRAVHDQAASLDYEQLQARLAAEHRKVLRLETTVRQLTKQLQELQEAVASRNPED